MTRKLEEMSVTVFHPECDFGKWNSNGTCTRLAIFNIFVSNRPFAIACELHNIHYQNLANEYIRNRQNFRIATG